MKGTSSVVVFRHGHPFREQKIGRSNDTSPFTTIRNEHKKVLTDAC